MYGFGSVLFDGAPKTPVDVLKVHTKIKIEASLGQSPVYSKRLVDVTTWLDHMMFYCSRHFPVGKCNYPGSESSWTSQHNNNR
jgi:hypothetical protein